MSCSTCVTVYLSMWPSSKFLPVTGVQVSTCKNCQLVYFCTCLPIYITMPPVKLSLCLLFSHFFTYLPDYLYTYLPVICISVSLHVYESLIIICNDHFRLANDIFLTFSLATIKSHVSPSIGIESFLSHPNRLICAHKIVDQKLYAHKTDIHLSIFRTCQNVQEVLRHKYLNMVILDSLQWL